MSLIVPLAVLLLAPPCLAGPPFNVDDPETPEPRHYEINLAYLSSQVRGSEAQEFPSLEVNYGYTDTVELTVGVGAASARQTGESRTIGWADSALEAKWRFQEERPRMPQVALFYGLKVPTASRSQGLGTGKADNTFALLGQKSFRRLSVYANVGYTVVGSSDEKNNAYYGVAGEFQATERTTIGAQLYGNTPTAEGERSELAWGVGLIRTFVRDRALLLQVGRSFQGISDLNVYAGVQFILGPTAPRPAPAPAEGTATPTPRAGGRPGRPSR